MGMLPFFNEMNRQKAFSLIETTISIGLLLFLIPPIFIQVRQYSQQTNMERIQADNSMNIQFVMNSIQEEMSLIRFNENEFQPKNLVESNLLMYKHPNGKIVRYYKVGDELVKDFNYIGYNAITPKIIQRFQVRREDSPGFITVFITVQDKDGYVHQRKITKKNPI